MRIERMEKGSVRVVLAEEDCVLLAQACAEVSEAGQVERAAAVMVGVLGAVFEVVERAEWVLTERGNSTEKGREAYLFRRAALTWLTWRTWFRWWSRMGWRGRCWWRRRAWRSARSGS